MSSHGCVPKLHQECYVVQATPSQDGKTLNQELTSFFSVWRQSQDFARESERKLSCQSNFIWHHGAHWNPGGPSWGRKWPGHNRRRKSWFARNEHQRRIREASSAGGDAGQLILQLVVDGHHIQFSGHKSSPAQTRARITKTLDGGEGNEPDESSQESGQGKAGDLAPAPRLRVCIIHPGTENDTVEESGNNKTGKDENPREHEGAQEDNEKDLPPKGTLLCTAVDKGVDKPDDIIEALQSVCGYNLTVPA